MLDNCVILVFYLIAVRSHIEAYRIILSSTNGHTFRIFQIGHNKTCRRPNLHTRGGTHHRNRRQGGYRKNHNHNQQLNDRETADRVSPITFGASSTMVVRKRHRICCARHFGIPPLYLDISSPSSVLFSSSQKGIFSNLTARAKSLLRPRYEPALLIHITDNSASSPCPPLDINRAIQMSFSLSSTVKAGRIDTIVKT